jgi:CRP/FNR family cyclic AMP-dependent transcriptional regulator
VQQTRIEALQRMPIFGGIRADMLEFLVNEAEMTTVPGGEYFFRENDKAAAMFVLESGEISILKSWNDQQYEIGHLGPGDCFGEMALIDLFPRSASVLAAQDCTAIALTTESVYRLYEKDLEQFALIQMNIGRELSRRLRVADVRLFSFKMGEPFTDSEELPPLA